MDLINHEIIPNLVNGQDSISIADTTFPKISPVDGRVLFQASRSNLGDINYAVQVALNAQAEWAQTPAVLRGMILQEVTRVLDRRKEDMARMIAMETGKSYKDALGETGAAIAQGFFMAGEGQRLYGKTTTSGIPGKHAMTVREPIGVAGLIIAANTPIANIAWKVFPALICGNTAILKASEDAPGTAWLFGQITREAGLPSGVLNIVHGFGPEAGHPLVQHPSVGVVSFTGSTQVGRQIAQICAARLARVSLELGGKNPLIVCADANLENAAHWGVLSAFSNAGQRCASASRIIVEEAVYDEFKEILLRKTSALKVGPSDQDDLGPVINERQLHNMLEAVDNAQLNGSVILTGGGRLIDGDLENGFYMAPTLLENVDPEAEISIKELFGPIACLYNVRSYREALALANASPYGLTAAIHTSDIDKAIHFSRNIRSGVAVINAGTYGSEPHMPFGGNGLSGNGTREPGTEALDLYSSLKNIYIQMDVNREDLK